MNMARLLVCFCGGGVCEIQGLSMLGKHCTTESYLHPHGQVFNTVRFPFGYMDKVAGLGKLGRPSPIFTVKKEKKNT
jgi:hypothetical protein